MPAKAQKNKKEADESEAQVQTSNVIRQQKFEKNNNLE
jgi:hypothetical protein